MAPQKNIVFCPSCQVEVEAAMSLGPGGKKVPRCTICGTVIDKEAHEDNSSVALDEMSFVDESIHIPEKDGIIVTGYSPQVREIIYNGLMEKQMGREIIQCKNGEEMVIQVIENFREGKKNGTIDLIITDVPMPFLNGINAAIGLRAIEKNYVNHDLVPVLFLTNKACDDTFKKVIRFLAPAKYATLGPVDNHKELSAHLNKIFSLLAKEKW